MAKTGKILGVALAALTWVSPLAASAQSLTDTMIRAYRNSGLVRQYEALVRVQDENVAQAVARMRPIINYAAQATRSAADTTIAANPLLGRSAYETTVYQTTIQLGVTADWLLYDFGATQSQVYAAYEAVMATRQGLISTEQNVLLAAVAAHMNVRMNQQLVALAENKVSVMQGQLSAANSRFEVGEITRTDVALAEAAIAGARAEVATAQAALARARESYRAATGGLPGSLSAAPAPQLPGSLDGAFAVARRTHPDVISGQHQVKSAEYGVVAAQNGMKPRLAARGQFAVDDEGQRQGSVGLSVSGPIYQGGALSSGVRQAQARVDQAKGALHNTTAQVLNNVGNAWADLTSSASSITAANAQIAATQSALDGVQEEVKLGARTTQDALNAEQDVLDARGNLIRAQMQQEFARYQILASIGRLTAQDLRLGIATYDPAAYYTAVKDAPVRNVSPQGERLDRVLRGVVGQ